MSSRSRNQRFEADESDDDTYQVHSGWNDDDNQSDGTNEETTSRPSKRGRKSKKKGSSNRTNNSETDEDGGSDASSDSSLTDDDSGGDNRSRRSRTKSSKNRQKVRSSSRTRQQSDSSGDNNDDEATESFSPSSSPSASVDYYQYETESDGEDGDGQYDDEGDGAGDETLTKKEKRNKEKKSKTNKKKSASGGSNQKKNKQDKTRKEGKSDKRRNGSDRGSSGEENDAKGNKSKSPKGGADGEGDDAPLQDHMVVRDQNGLLRRRPPFELPIPEGFPTFQDLGLVGSNPKVVKLAKRYKKKIGTILGSYQALYNQGLYPHRIKEPEAKNRNSNRANMVATRQQLNKIERAERKAQEPPKTIFDPASVATVDAVVDNFKSMGVLPPDFGKDLWGEGDYGQFTVKPRTKKPFNKVRTRRRLMEKDPPQWTNFDDKWDIHKRMSSGKMPDTSPEKIIAMKNDFEKVKIYRQGRVPRSDPFSRLLYDEDPESVEFNAKSVMADNASNEAVLALFKPEQQSLFDSVRKFRQADAGIDLNNLDKEKLQQRFEKRQLRKEQLLAKRRAFFGIPDPPPVSATRAFFAPVVNSVKYLYNLAKQVFDYPRSITRWSVFVLTRHHLRIGISKFYDIYYSLLRPIWGYVYFWFFLKPLPQIHRALKWSIGFELLLRDVVIKSVYTIITSFRFMNALTRAAIIILTQSTRDVSRVTLQSLLLTTPGQICVFGSFILWRWGFDIWDAVERTYQTYFKGMFPGWDPFGGYTTGYGTSFNPHTLRE